MKTSAFRTWALTLVAAAGLVGAGALADRTLERVREDHRRQGPTSPERALQPAADASRLAVGAAQVVQSETTAGVENDRALVRRYIPLVVPGLALLLLLCIVGIWHLAL